MTINAISPIYDFRPVRRVSEPQPAAKPVAKQEPTKKQQLDLFEPQREAIDDPEPQATTAKANEDRDSVRALFDEFFAGRIKRHDADRDGLLSRQEFYGSDEQFTRLDEDDDGLVGAADLKKEFLASNPEMREMAEGFTRELYDQILNSATDDPETLAETVDDFFADMVARNDSTGDGNLHTDVFPGSAEEFRQIAGEDTMSINRDDMVRNFKHRNPDLVELRDSLVQLKDMVRPERVQPQHVDVYT